MNATLFVSIQSLKSCLDIRNEIIDIYQGCEIIL
jgi:hypothetical protein